MIEVVDQKITNADRIRSMTDEELAAIIMCPTESGLAEIECSRDDSCDCYQCCLNWLRQEAEQEDDNAK